MNDDVEVAKGVEVVDVEIVEVEMQVPRTNPIPSSPPPAPPIGEFNYPPHIVPPYSLSRNCPAPCCFKKKIGRFYVFTEYSDGSPLCMVGPCWPMYFVTLFLVAGGTAVVLGGIARNSIPVLVLGSILGFITASALTLTACRNPGIVRRRQEPLQAGEIYDDRAMSYRPMGSIYEYETGTLIKNVDHFCPWTSTVIAGSNIISFRIFASCVCVLICFAIVVVILFVAKVLQPL